MNCAWEQFLRLLPMWLKAPVNKIGRDKLLELRLRIDLPPELVFRDSRRSLDQLIKQEDLIYCINAATAYSPWASETTEKGYITATGGHRIGVCGSYVAGKSVKHIIQPTMLCLRVARDFPGIAKSACERVESTLILGRPGSGKTTLLRDLIRQYSNGNNGAICVVDEREELFPKAQGRHCFFPGTSTDVLSGCSKCFGIDMLLRCMTPTVIAIDEITAKEDCEALLHAGWCGVNLLATAHASDVEDLFRRPIYRPILEANLFSRFLVLHEDKSWHMERSKL